MTAARPVGVVLAGGASSRMGRDKAMLELDGATLLDQAIALLRDAGCTRIVVSGDRPAHGGVPDDAPGRGPVGGLATVLPGIEGDRLLVVPVDLAGLQASMLLYLLEALDDAPAACFAAHPLPWAARLDGALRRAVRDAIAAAPRGPSMHALHGAVAGITIPVPAGTAWRNLNTPADWQALAR